MAPEEAAARRRPPRADRDKDSPQPTDIAERMIALQRRNHAPRLREKDRDREREREKEKEKPIAPALAPPPHPSASTSVRSPQGSPSKPSPNLHQQTQQAQRTRGGLSRASAGDTDAPSEDFLRRLRISSSPHPQSPAPVSRHSRHQQPHGHSHNHHGERQGRLFNPDADPGTPRRSGEAERESVSDRTGSEAAHASPSPVISPALAPAASAAPARPHARDAHRTLFDHRKDDPVRFSVLARPGPGKSSSPAPAPKGSVASGDANYVSASSTSSSYAHSITSSAFTLSSGSGVTSSSGASGLFEGPESGNGGGSGSGGAGNNAFAAQLKRLYRAISALESKILSEDAHEYDAASALANVSGDNESGGGMPVVVLHAKGAAGMQTPGVIGAGVVMPLEMSKEERERQKWAKLIADHKQLAEMMHTLLSISLSPSVPASLRHIPTKYNILIRLWTHAFHRLLEALRHAARGSSVGTTSSAFCLPSSRSTGDGSSGEILNVSSAVLAREHLQGFLCYAYTFYTGLLEEPALRSFRGGWLEALGDLARYRMAVAAMCEVAPGAARVVEAKGAMTQAAVAGRIGRSGEVASLAAPAGGEAMTTAATAASSSRPRLPQEQTLALPVRPRASSPSSSRSSHSSRSLSPLPHPSSRSRTHSPTRSPPPSVGPHAARLLALEPEAERWRSVAREWYGAGVADTPGAGKLHHHLGLLSREVEGEEVRACYHFVKSMTALHPFPTSRESILPLWSPAAQARRAAPGASATELFVLLHGMLFTNIQLDDFQPTLARFLERVEIESGDGAPAHGGPAGQGAAVERGIQQTEWIMMAVINIAAVLEYGRPNGIVRRAGGVGSLRDPSSSAGAPNPSPNAASAGAVMTVGQPGGMRLAKRSHDVEGAEDKKAMDVYDGDGDEEMKSPAPAEASPAFSDPASADAADAEPTLPLAFKLALELTFALLRHALAHPTRRGAPFARPSPNPYLAVTLTFLATLLRHAQTRQLLERAVPWEELAAFFSGGAVPRGVLAAQAPPSSVNNEGPGSAGVPWAMLTTGCAPPLPEDWCVRGMEWVARRVFERGFWRAGEERPAELDVLDAAERAPGPVEDGVIEDGDDDDDRHAAASGMKSGGVRLRDEAHRRWVRVARAGFVLAAAVPGFVYRGPREWTVEGALAEKVAQWRAEEHAAREEEEARRRRRGRGWEEEEGDAMDVDEEEGLDGLEDEETEDEEGENEEIRELKARRRYLRNLLQQQRTPHNTAVPPRRSRPRGPRHPGARTNGAAPTRPPLHLVAGYTVLVIDTNILLSSLSLISAVVESLRWTVVVPLPVVMELDGLASAAPPLGDAARAALAYVTNAVRAHATALKVQTSKGNYLTSLSVRAEQVDFAMGGVERDRSMDDLILKAAIWQDEHWVDRSAMLRSGDDKNRDTSGAVKVVLLSLDRNLRLKSQSRDLPAANEKEIALVLAKET